MAAESLLLATISYSEIRNYLEIFMLPTLNPHPPPWAWVTFPAVFQLPRHSECQQPDPRSSMRQFRTFPSPGITAEDSPVSRTRRLAHETTLEDPSVSRCLVSEKPRSAHEKVFRGCLVSEKPHSAHEKVSQGCLVSGTARSAHGRVCRGGLVSGTAHFAHGIVCRCALGRRKVPVSAAFECRTAPLGDRISRKCRL